jgi:hypothetical protein
MILLLKLVSDESETEMDNVTAVSITGSRYCQYILAELRGFSENWVASFSHVKSKAAINNDIIR